MMRMKKSVLPVMVIGLVFVMGFPCYGFVRATPYGEFDVFAPTALSHSSYGVLYGSDYQAMKLDGLSAYVGGLGSYVQTLHYTDPAYNDYWSPYSNRSAFPPNNATILSVKMLCVVKAQVTKPFTLTLLYGMGASIFVVNSPMYYATTSYQEYSYNITSATSWNASELKSSVPGKDFQVRVMSWADTGIYNLYVDYVGLSYTWSYPVGGEDTEQDSGQPGHFTMPSITGTMGIIGFLGMVGVPAASIWFLKQDGGSKIYAGLTAALTFILCFALFLGSMGP